MKGGSYSAGSNRDGEFGRHVSASRNTHAPSSSANATGRPRWNRARAIWFSASQPNRRSIQRGGNGPSLSTVAAGVRAAMGSRWCLWRESIGPLGALRGRCVRVLGTVDRSLRARSTDHADIVGTDGADEGIKHGHPREQKKM